MNKVALDASALHALIQNEQGAEIVKPLVHKAVMSTVNVAEILTVLQKTDVTPQEGIHAISDFIFDIIPFNTEQAQAVAELQPLVKHKGLSLGDCACLALAQKMNLPVLYCR
ncbi:MAG: type II toxin-antitoxin system VapC family toxin [Nitrosopumilus sp.]|nr:type II toxin-antitoxin system VapC family toxin [Nitrosopumilus sp.]